MTRRQYKSRSYRRISTKTPGGRVVVHYKKKKPKIAKCANCNAILKGVPREFPIAMRNLPKTKKRPERPYGGVLCSRCMRKKIVEQTRIVAQVSGDNT